MLVFLTHLWFMAGSINKHWLLLFGHLFLEGAFFIHIVVQKYFMKVVVQKYTMKLSSYIHS